MPGHSVCCILNCRNTRRSGDYKFYKFPQREYKLDQCKLWIAAIRKNVSSMANWEPRQADVICSAHFLGGKKANEIASPNYVPKLFPASNKFKSNPKKQMATIKRHDRFMKRRIANGELVIQKKKKEYKRKSVKLKANETSNKTNNEGTLVILKNQQCQVDNFCQYDKPSRTLICNRFICDGISCDAQTQTDIAIDTSSVVAPIKEEETSEEEITISYFPSGGEIS